MVTQPLPAPKQDYDKVDETKNRRIIEHNFRAINNQLNIQENKISRSESLSTRRFQFLLMGAG